MSGWANHIEPIKGTRRRIYRMQMRQCQSQGRRLWSAGILEGRLDEAWRQDAGLSPVVPYLGLAAARQHQQLGRRDQPGRHLTVLARDIIERSADADELRVGEQVLAVPLWVHRDGLAGIDQVFEDQQQIFV